MLRSEESRISEGDVAPLARDVPRACLARAAISRYVLVSWIPNHSSMWRIGSVQASLLENRERRSHRG